MINHKLVLTLFLIIQAVVEVEKGAILEENEIEERQKREEQLMCIRR